MNPGHEIQTPWGPMRTKFEQNYVVDAIQMYLDTGSVPEGVKKNTVLAWIYRLGINRMRRERTASDTVQDGKITNWLDVAKELEDSGLEPWEVDVKLMSLWCPQ